MTDDGASAPRSDRTGRNAPVTGESGFPGELVDRPSNQPGAQPNDPEPETVRPDQAAGAGPPAPGWTGLNHLALVTDDLDTTTRFWHHVLGAELVATIGTDTFRHYFFDVGGSCVAFFEYRDLELQTFAKPAGVPDPRAAQFDHLSLDLADEAAVRALRDRLLAAGCEVTDVIDHGLMSSIYFTDPNGIALEASWWVDDPTSERSPDRHFADPDPVPAVAEIRAGRPLSAVATRLVDGPTTADVYVTPSE